MTMSKYQKMMTRAALAAVITPLLYACDQENIKKEQQGYQNVTSRDLVMLNDFEGSSELAAYTLINADASHVKGYESEKALSLDLKSGTHNSAGISFRPKSGDAWDWSQWESISISMDLANQGDQPVQIYLDVEDAKGQNFTRSASVSVGEFGTYYAKLSGHDLHKPADTTTELNFLSGLRGNPETWESNEKPFIWMWGVQALDLSSITKITLSLQNNLHDKNLVIDNLRVTKNPKMNQEFLTSIVDEFGQNAKKDFRGKIKSLKQLHDLRDQELKSLDGKLMAGRSKFSGWKDGPKLKATGYFRTEKYNGKWALVDPEGYLYFATGLDIIRLSNSTTLTGYDYDASLVKQRSADDLTPEDSSGLLQVNNTARATRKLVSSTRSNMFTWLPDFDDELSNHYSYRRSAHSGPLSQGETFSFYQANLERKYGEHKPNSFLSKWEEVTLDRMRNWGFTSLGNWTDPRYYDNQKVPFFANGWIIGNFKTVSSGFDFWGPMPDVFDPEFAVRADVTVKQVAKEIQNTPWAVGVFIDNEKSFGRPESDQLRYGIVINTLGRNGATVPTKAEFTGLMKAKYRTISAFNKAWNLSLSSWSEFDKGFDAGEITDAQRQDYSAMLEYYASQYYRIVAQAMDKYLPNHLYLGSRLPDWGMPLEVVRAAAKYVDVISFNAYKEGLTKKKWAFLSEFDMPTIIGEFHMGASESGLYHPGLIQAETFEDRAQMFLDYMDSVVESPYFVGAHWFQYMDSPLTGRAYDGENYNVGFVDVTDTPYPNMVKAAQELGKDLYKDRYGK